MKFPIISTIAVTLAAMVGTAQAELKVASVDINLLYTKYYKRFETEIRLKDSMEEIKPVLWDTLGKMVDSGMLGPYTPLLRIVCDKHEADPNEDRLFCGANAMVLVLTENPMNGGLAATSVELMAQSLGVGVLYSGFLMGAINRTQEIKDRLKIKENQHLAAVMLMGVPDVKYHRTAPRKKANIIWE